MPLLGTFAGASARAYGLGAGGLAIPAGYNSIATTTVGVGGQASISFTSIPQTFKHLQVRWLVRGLANVGTDVISLRINSDTSSNYSFHRLYGNGATASSDSFANQTYVFGGDMPANTAAASIFAAGVLDILDYSNTNKYKTTKVTDGRDQNGSGFIWFNSANWRNTNAITTLTFTAQNGNYAQYSSFALYGIEA